MELGKYISLKLDVIKKGELLKKLMTAKKGLHRTMATARLKHPLYMVVLSAALARIDWLMTVRKDYKYAARQEHCHVTLMSQTHTQTHTHTHTHTHKHAPTRYLTLGITDIYICTCFVGPDQPHVYKKHDIIIIKPHTLIKKYGNFIIIYESVKYKMVCAQVTSYSLCSDIRYFWQVTRKKGKISAPWFELATKRHET